MRRSWLPVLATLFLLILMWAGVPLLNRWLSPVTAAPLRQATPTFRPTRTPMPTPTGELSPTPTLTLTATPPAVITATVTVSPTGTVVPPVTAPVSPTATPARLTPLPALPPADERRLTTIGSATLSVAPDFFEVEIAVETVAPTPVDAFEENLATAEDVLRALARAGVEPAEVRRVGFEVFTRPAEGRQGIRQPPPQGRTVTIVVQRLRFPVENEERLSEALAAATGAGAERILAVELHASRARRERAERQVRRLALERAYAKAREIVELAGLEIAGVVAVRELDVSRSEAASRNPNEVSAAFEVTFAVRSAGER